MLKAPLPADEVQRLAALHSLHLLDTLPEERFERITRIAQRLFNVPIASITLVDANRQWFKSCQGLSVRETPRDIAFCAYTILTDEALVIPDAQLDPRFSDDPFVTSDPYIRFYAGQALKGPKGYNIGTLFIGDYSPRQMSDEDVQALNGLAVWAENEINTLQLNEALAIQQEQASTLQEQAQLLDLAYNTIMVRDLRNNTITLWNRGAENLYGWKKEEVLGKNPLDFLPTQFPRPQQEVEAELFQEGYWEGELIHTKRDGTQIIVSSRWALQRDELGEPLAILEINNNITARKHAEAEREQQYQQAEHARSETRAVLDAVSEGIALVSSDRRFLSINHQFAEFFGVRPDEILGRQFDEIQPLVEQIFSDPDKLRAMVIDSATDVEKQFTQIVAQQWPKPRELELFSTPVRTLDSEQLGRLYVFRDVTHEREVDRMKSEFVSLVSHELRTPLTSIKGYIDLLVDGDAGELTEEQLEYLEVAKKNADRLVLLINDLLDVSRIEQGRLELHPSPLDLTRLISDVAQSLRPQIEAKDQHLILEVNELLPVVLGDADRVTQIITNLLSNAYKYTPAGGTISVLAQSEEKDFVCVDIRDTGIGLSAEEQSKLFTRFYRAKNRMTQEVGGTGLGLTISRSLVEMQGGEIRVSSAPGEGSTFSFTLPTTQHTAQSEAESTIPQPGGRILVVDDEPDIANLIKRYLEHARYQVLIARNASEALSIAKSEHPDLITLDIMLPDADGFTVLEWLKSDSATAAIPVVLLSMMDDSGRGKLLGAVDYLRKPIQERMLLAHVGLILSNDRAHIILVADDDDDERGLIAENLRSDGYHVIEAVDGAEAVAMAKRDQPGLALIDIKMPNMDGIAALRSLRSEPATRNLPVIMMTSSPGVMEENRSVVEALGGAILLGKPYTAEELATAIARKLATPLQT
jgi:PAS domain S-box-containing protein